MRKEEKGKKRTHDSPSSAHSFSFSLAVPFLRFKGLWGVTVWEAWTKWKEMKSDKWEKRSHALFICFTSVHSSHGGRQSRVLCSCCVLCYRFIVMDWAKWGKHEWTGNKDHTTATKGNERNKKKTNEKSTQWREHAFGPFHLSLFI